METELAKLIWRTRYRANGEADYSATCKRVAKALASVETSQQGKWQDAFYGLLNSQSFLPGGRILSGAGIDRQVTLFNCFVMGVIPDDMSGIFDAVKQGALTMQQGGGVGYDFSTLRPQGLYCHRVGGIASGPVSFMRIWDAMCATVLSTGARRGAMMATLRCDHPDIETYITAKADPRELRNFNVSVLVSDDFMQAVEDDADWPLVFPQEQLSAEDRLSYPDTLMRAWSGGTKPEPCAVIRTLKARDLWQRIMQANYDTAEPGVLFIDRINAQNNLYYRERISATNPCGEIPLPPYGACDLGSINLTRFVEQPFSDQAQLDTQSLAETAALAIRALDNVIDLSGFPLPEQADQARGTRRIGLGITGLADTLIMLGLHYDEQEGRELAAEAMRIVCHQAYRTSIELAEEKGVFPFFDKTSYLKSPFIQQLPSDIQEAIEQHGIRNSHLTAIAPAGTISLLADNVSSGVEPVFQFRYKRRVGNAQSGTDWYDVEDYAARLWWQRESEKGVDTELGILSEVFIDTSQLAPADHLAMQAAVQPFVDSAISKTVNVPQNIPFEDFQDLYRQAHRLGLKGCTTFRPNPVTGSVLADAEQPDCQPEEGSHCCGLEREGA